MKRRETLGIDLTPIVDVVFILLIFFIVTSVFKKDDQALLLDLPSSNAKSVAVKENEIFIELSKDELSIKGIKVSFESLEDNIKAIKDKNNPVYLRIDKSVEYSRVIKVLDILQKYNLVNLALITKQEKN